MSESEVQSAKTVGYDIPPRRADCTGRRPSWYPFQINVCDQDDPDPPALTARHLTLPPAA